MKSLVLLSILISHTALAGDDITLAIAGKSKPTTFPLDKLNEASQ